MSERIEVEIKIKALEVAIAHAMAVYVEARALGEYGRMQGALSALQDSIAELSSRHIRLDELKENEL
jgi:hypothetical protein